MIKQKLINDLSMNEVSNNLDKLDIKLIFKMIDPYIKDGVPHKLIKIDSDDKRQIKILFRMEKHTIDNISKTRNKPFNMLFVCNFLPKVLLMNPNQIAYNINQNGFQLIIISIIVQILIFI